MIPIPYTSTDWPSYTYELVLRFKLLHKKVRTPKKSQSPFVMLETL